MEYRKSEIRAGVFLLISFVIFSFMVFAVSDVQSLFRKKKDVRVLFSFSDGIEKNAPVRYAGMKIGRVRDVRVSTEQYGKIELLLTVYREIEINEDATAAVKTLGLVGGKYVEITAGSPNAKPLPPGGILTGEDSLKLEDVSRAALDVITKLRSIASNLDMVLGDPAMAKSLRAAVRNIQEVSDNIKNMTAPRTEVAEGLKGIPGIIKKLDEASTNLKIITERTDKILVDNKKNIDETLESIRKLAENLKDTSEDVKGSPWKLLRKP